MRRVKVKISGVRITGVISDDTFVMMENFEVEGSHKDVVSVINETMKNVSTVVSTAIRFHCESETPRSSYVPPK